MRFIFTGLFLFFGTFVSRGQTSSSTPPADSSAIETSIFSLGTSYGNNASYYGQSSAEGKLPYATLSSTYQAANGLYGSVSLVRLLQSGPGISEIDLSAGYAFDITKKLSGTVNYIRYFFAKNSPLLQTANNNTARASLTYDWWLNSSLYGDYAFGEDNSDYFLTLENYKTIDLGAFSSSDYVTIEPSLQLTAGTNSFSESYQVRKGRKLPGPLDPLLGGGRGGRTETVTYDYKQFGLMSYNFKIPLAYNRAHYSIEAAYQLSVLDNKIVDEYRKYAEYADFKGAQSFFTLSFNYYFFKD